VAELGVPGAATSVAPAFTIHPFATRRCDSADLRHRRRLQAQTISVRRIPMRQKTVDNQFTLLAAESG
jgi:hypothetical protein